MSFSVHNLAGSGATIEEIAEQSDAEVQAGSTSNHMDFIRRHTNRGIGRQIPDASQDLTRKNLKEMNKYIIFGVVIYLLCC